MIVLLIVIVYLMSIRYDYASALVRQLPALMMLVVQRSIRSLLMVRCGQA